MSDKSSIVYIKRDAADARCFPAAVAVAGVVFDETDPVHRTHDALRYAEWIQQARDEKNYARADEVRDLAQRVGCIVRLSKSHTFVVDGWAEADWSEVPSWWGYSQWVAPDEVNGRHVIDTCFRHDADEVHSIKVANWRDHPNLGKARNLGIPDALWTEAGQATLEATKSMAWYLDQEAAIEGALAALQLRAVEHGLLREIANRAG